MLHLDPVVRDWNYLLIKRMSNHYGMRVGVNLFDFKLSKISAHKLLWLVYPFRIVHGEQIRAPLLPVKELRMYLLVEVVLVSLLRPFKGACDGCNERFQPP